MNYISNSYIIVEYLIPLQTFKLFSANSLKVKSEIICFKYRTGDYVIQGPCNQKDHHHFTHCKIEKRDGVITERMCIENTTSGGIVVKEGCVLVPSFIGTDTKTRVQSQTSCYCKSDNCNSNCNAVGPCTEHTLYNITTSNYPKELKYKFCDGICTTSGGDQVTNPPTTAESNATTAEHKIEDSKATEKLDASTVEDKGEGSKATEAATEEGKGKDSKATEKSEGATGEHESGTGAGEHESGCQRITNSFEMFFLFWVLASLVN